MAFKPVSFYGQSQGPLTPARRDYMADPRRMMAEQLIQQGSSTAPVQSPLEGIARALQAGVGGYFGGQAKREMMDRETQLNSVMSKALAGTPAVPANTFAGSSGPGGMNDVQIPVAAQAAKPATYQSMMDVLSKSGNTDATPFMNQIAMAQAAQQQAMEQADLARKQDLAAKIELKAAPGGPNSPTGRPASAIQLSNEYDLRVQRDGKDAADEWYRKFANQPFLNLGDRYIPRADAAGGAVGEGVPINPKPEQMPAFKGEQAAAEAAGTQSIAQSGKAFEKLGAVNQNLANIDAAIAAIDSGAETGPIYKMLPSVTAASVELDNIRNRMGLDVIGSVTFGALSKGELDLALDTALPTGLEPPQLREWLVNKKTAQQKLARHLNEAAIYLGTPGNTPASWAKMQKAKMDANGGAGGTPPTSPPAKTPPPPPGFK